MKRTLVPLLFSWVLFAQSQLLSPIPLPRTVVVDLDPQPYDDTMLENALATGQIFTFLAKSQHAKDNELVALRQAYLSLFHLHNAASGGEYRVAFLLPSKRIGKYAASTTESALAYLAQRGLPFKMDVVEVADEEEATLQEALPKLSGYHLVIAPVTPKGAAFLCRQSLPGKVYIPTLHETRVACANERVRFGGIDYDRQVQTLALLGEPTAKTYVVTNNSGLSTTLSNMVEKYLDVENTIVIGKNGYYKHVIEKYRDLNQSTMFLNVPVVKSSLFLSQMTLADFKPRLLLSTQINYSPLLLTLTQYHDRENMVVASSIGEMDPFLAEGIALVGRDVRFNWINYATVVGLDNDFAATTGERRWTKEMFEGNSLAYEVKLFDAGLYRFVPRKAPEPVEEVIRLDDEEKEPTPETPYSSFSQEEMIDQTAGEMRPGFPSLR